MSLNQVDCSTRTSPAGAPVFMSNLRMTATLRSVSVVPPSRSATYSIPPAMSLPYGSFSTSGGVSAARAAGVVGAALGGVDRAEHLDVRRHRFEGPVGRRVHRQSETIADEERPWRLGLLREQRAGDDADCQ